MMKNERGFTIMELLVVIVIIGVLAAIGVPAYSNFTTRAKKTACEANRRTLQTAVGLFHVDAEDGGYPQDIDALVTYLDNAKEIKCPAGGNYTIDATSHEVDCDFKGH